MSAGLFLLMVGFLVWKGSKWAANNPDKSSAAAKWITMLFKK